MSDGWIKLHRAVMDSAVWNNADLFKFWCWCLMKASHSAVKTSVGFKAVALARGQFMFGRRMAHLETGLTERTVRTCVKALISDQRISVKTTNAFSIVTILNYDRYQIEEKQNDQRVTSKTTNERPTSDQRVTNGTDGFDSQTSVLPPRARAPAKIVVEEFKEVSLSPARARVGEEGVEEGAVRSPSPYAPPDISETLLNLAREVYGLTPEGILTGWLTVQKWPEDWIIEATQQTAQSGKRGSTAAQYAAGIMRGWTRDGKPERTDAPNHGKSSGKPRGATTGKFAGRDEWANE